MRIDYEVGDRVVATGAMSGNYRIVDVKGTILKIYPDEGKYAVEFDKRIDGHSCGHLGKNGYCWFVTQNYLKSIFEDPEINIEKLEITFEEII